MTSTLSFIKIAVISALFLADTSPADVPLFTDIGKYSALVNASNGLPMQTFRSSDIIAPVFMVNSWDKKNVDTASHMFLGRMYGPGKSGPMIFDARDLSLVYADQQYYKSMNSDVRVINGTRYLTALVLGEENKAAYCLVYDEMYRIRYNISVQGIESDMHELQVTPEGTAILTTYYSIPFDCSPVGGPRSSTLCDSGFREIDLETGAVVFNWSASAHFEIWESYSKFNNTFDRNRGMGYDFFHINSVEKTADGNYLVSSRNLCVLVLINGRDGSIIWRLGGRHNQFSDLSNGTAVNFAWQHDARLHHGESQITVFDNHITETAYCEGKCHTRGLVIDIDSDKLTARLVREYFHPESINSEAMGSLQLLETGNVLLAFGFNPAIVEYTIDGTPVMDIQLGHIGIGAQGNNGVYRASKYNWTGRPTWPPSAALDTPEKGMINNTIYLSWNGATDVASWSVFASNDSAAIWRKGNVLAQHDRSGFETKIHFDNENNFNYIGAAAISARGAILGHTAIFNVKLGDPSDLYSTRYHAFFYNWSDILKRWHFYFLLFLLAMFFLLFATIRALLGQEKRRRADPQWKPQCARRRPSYDNNLKRQEI